MLFPNPFATFRARVLRPTPSVRAASVRFPPAAATGPWRELPPFEVFTADGEHFTPLPRLDG